MAKWKACNSSPTLSLKKLSLVVSCGDKKGGSMVFKRLPGGNIKKLRNRLGGEMPKWYSNARRYEQEQLLRKRQRDAERFLRGDSSESTERFIVFEAEGGFVTTFVLPTVVSCGVFEDTPECESNEHFRFYPITLPPLPSNHSKTHDPCPYPWRPKKAFLDIIDHAIWRAR